MTGRYRRETGSWGPRIVVLGIAIAMVVMALPAGSITLGAHPRSAGADVVVDTDGTLGLDVANTVSHLTVSRLVTVTNSLGVSVTVTVTVTNSNKHDLYLGGTNHGSSLSFGLADGASQQVDVDAHPSEDLVVFDVSASATGVSVTANGRSASVV